MGNRIIFVDKLRILSMIAIVLMHITDDVTMLLQVDYRTFEFHFTNIINSATKFAIPMFVMISGSLMLNRGLQYKDILKRLLHLTRVYLFWSFIYTLVSSLKYIPDYTPIGLIVNIIVDTLIGPAHLWFLFLLFGLYLLIPVLDVLIKNVSDDIKRNFIIMAIFLVFLLPSLTLNGFVDKVLGEHIAHINMGYFSGYIVYFVLGYWLRNYQVKNRKLLYIVTIVAFLLTVLVPNLTAMLMCAEFDGFKGHMSPNIMILTIGMFLIFKTHDEAKEHTPKWIQTFAMLSFGVYLNHRLVLKLAESLILKNDSVTHVVGDTLILFIISFILCYFLAYLFFKIKYLKIFVR